MADYIYVYQLRCSKRVVLRTLIQVISVYANAAKHTSLYACCSADILVVCGWGMSRVLRTTRLLPKVVIYIYII